MHDQKLSLPLPSLEPALLNCVADNESVEWRRLTGNINMFDEAMRALYSLHGWKIDRTETRIALAPSDGLTLHETLDAFAALKREQPGWSLHVITSPRSRRLRLDGADAYHSTSHLQLLERCRLVLHSSVA